MQEDAHAHLVITAPEPFGPRLAFVAAARLTLGVLIELTLGASMRLVLAAPYLSEEVLDSGPLALSLQTALGKGVLVELATTGKQIRGLPEALARWKQTGQLALYQPAANVTSDHYLGSHAKFCISDSAAAYLGSANFTGLGLGGHLEMGVLLKGALASDIAGFWETLKELHVFQRV